MRSIFGLSLMTLVLLAGCKEEAPVEPQPVEPPPKTVEEISRDYTAALQPLFSGAAAESGFQYGMAEPILSQFSTVRAQYSAPKEINEKEAASRTETAISNHIKIARDAEQWYALDGLLRAHAMLNPSSQRYKSLRTKTDLMMERPWVKCTGFVGLGDDLIAFLSITDPKTFKTTSLQVREGEEFYPDAEGNSVLRLVKVIGAQSGLLLEFMKLPGETWEIPGPENK